MAISIDAPVPVDAPAATIKVDKHPVRPKVDTPQPTTGSNVAPPVERHRVTINSQPWSFFTVDDDATQHQTVDQVMLSRGAHHIHFTNPSLHLDREVTLDVPDHDITHVEKLDN
jgi:hypothetical protein